MALKLDFGKLPWHAQLGAFAAIALAGVGVGIGNIFGSFVSGALRNPAAAPKVFGNVLLGFALTEAIALFALLIALLLLFVF